MLPQGSDFADATYWTAYFLEMLLETQRSPKQPGDVLRIQAKDSGGLTVVYNFAHLRHWPLQQAAAANAQQKAGE
jgi:hypothetical protein